ncbi:MAG: transcriptional repressor LexA [Gammaproteobacteria bacterium]|nr:transcriptional repressor LexA [Gammaproteobacteria bacterium]MDJ0890491.1 transcriptional repressor LexA [Gammaproteobacteria bacterium]
MSIALTRRQQAIFDYLRDHQERFEHPPTLDELCHALGLSSRGSLHKHIQALVDAGLVAPMDKKQRGVRLTGLDQREEHKVRFLGYIAAGRPIEAMENPEEMEIPPMLKGNGNSYVLQVRGNSMIEEGILDGDWVVIEQRSHARNGEIVVALVDGQEATLKRIEQKPGEVVLYPANSDMAAMSYPPHRVRIQGVLVGQMRAYR